MNPVALWAEVVLSILAGCGTVMLALMLLVLRQMRDGQKELGERIMRLESFVIGRPPARMFEFGK